MQWEFGLGPMDKIVQHVQVKPHAKFEYFWTLGRSSFLISNFGVDLNIGKSILQ
jgi:hypothetical protein